MNKKAAMPVTYVIALIFGVVILAVIGYWLTIQSTKVVGRGATTECDALKSTFCQQWSITAFKIKPSVSFPSGCTEPKDANECSSLLGKESCGPESVDACKGKDVGVSCTSYDDFGVSTGTCKKSIAYDGCYCG